MMGLFFGFFLMVGVTWTFRRWHPFKLDQLFRRCQLVSAALYSLGHGGNDAQTTMGIITGLLVTAGYLQKFQVPFWVIIACHGARGDRPRRCRLRARPSAGGRKRRGRAAASSSARRGRPSRRSR